MTIGHPTLSYADALAAVGIDPAAGSQLVTATRIAAQHHPLADVGLPLLITQFEDYALAPRLKATLANAYPDNHPVTLFHTSATPAAGQTELPLMELDQLSPTTAPAMLYLPPLKKASFTDLQEIVAHLRAPDGCPWDREQTLASLREDLLGETIEAIEAIDAEQDATSDGSDNSAHIAEELGDVLLLVTMLTQIATEERRFKMGDVIHHIVTKLIRRHPHVFGTADVDGIDQIWANWDAIKAQEKADKGLPARHPLDDVPERLPALEKARVLQSKAAKLELLDRAELAQTNAQLVALVGDDPDERTIGELLWQLVALAKEHDVNAENALRAHGVRFRRAVASSD